MAPRTVIMLVHLALNLSSSVHNCGCVVDGGNTMAAILLLLLLLPVAQSWGEWYQYSLSMCFLFFSFT